MLHIDTWLVVEMSCQILKCQQSIVMFAVRRKLIATQFSILFDVYSLGICTESDIHDSQSRLLLQIPCFLTAELSCSVVCILHSTPSLLPHIPALKFEVIPTVCPLWREIRCQLHLKTSLLDEIDADCCVHGVRRCCTRMFEKWLIEDTEASIMVCYIEMYNVSDHQVFLLPNQFLQDEYEVVILSCKSVH